MLMWKVDEIFILARTNQAKIGALEEYVLNGGGGGSGGGGRASYVNEKICDVNIFGVEECSQLSDTARQLKKGEEYDKKIAQVL